jgi:two-component system, cell cycle response regulator DivK
VTKVLYIEHDDDNLYMLKMRLERVDDFEVIASNDIEQGCTLALTERPNVILMDLKMPDADCWEIVRRLKKDAQTSQTPIIGMSAYALDSECEKAIASGCDEFDAKPIEFEALHHSAPRRGPKITQPPCQSGRKRTVNTMNTEPNSLAMTCNPKEALAPRSFQAGEASRPVWYQSHRSPRRSPFLYLHSWHLRSGRSPEYAWWRGRT